MPEERKLVTVLFADVVGSTTMAAEHDAELVRRTLDRTFDRVAAAIAAHGGTVEKFIGDAVMAVFGVPAAHDDDAERALRAAFQLRDIVRASSGRIPLDVRIGVNSGEAVARTDAADQRLVTGVVVNLAQRLQSAAEPGEILAGDFTHRLTRGALRYGAPRTVTAKGIGEVTAHPAEALLDALPEQHRGIEGLRAPLIGREEEMRLLLESFQRVCAEGRPHLVTVFGAAGAGKSRLTTELIARLDGATVRVGRCLPYGEGVALWPIRQILWSDAGIAATDDAEGARARIRGAAAVAFAGSSEEDAGLVAARLEVLAGLAQANEAIPGVDAEGLADELAWGLRRYLERRAAVGPLVLVFEDIHWAAAELLDLIERVAEWAKCAIFVLCLARPEFLDARKGWGSGKVNATSIVIEPLTAEETRELVAALLDVDALGEDVRRSLVERSEGNPFYAEELIRLLIDTGRIALRDGRWVAVAAASLEVPPTIHGLISARLDAAPADVKRLLQVGAVIGRSFPTTALAALSEGRAPAPAQLRDAVRRDLLIDADERGTGGGRVYRFKHVLVRDVAYASIPKAERARLHDLFGHWYEEALGDRRADFLELIAHHAERAYQLACEVAGDDDAALAVRSFALLREAASVAWERGDQRPALELWRRAQTVAEAGPITGPERLEVAAEVVLAELRLDTRQVEIERGRALLPALRARGPSRLLAELISMLALGRDTELMREAIDVARQTGDETLLAELSAAHAGRIALGTGLDLAAAEEAARTAAEIAERIGAPALRARALMALSVVDHATGRFSDALRRMDEAEAVARATGVRTLLLEVLWNRMSQERVAGDPAVALHLTEETGRIREELGGERGRKEHLIDVGRALAVTGQLEASRRWLETAVSACDPVEHPGARAYALYMLARTLVWAGDGPGALRAIEEAQALRPRDGMSQSDITRAWSATADALRMNGSVAEGEAIYREGLARLGGSRPQVRAWFQRFYAAFLVAEGRTSEARTVIAEARPLYAHEWAVGPRRELDQLLARCVELEGAGQAATQVVRGSAAT